jgi:mRNA interferase RelE/StbE
VSYCVQLSLPAKKQLDRFDHVTAQRLDDRLKELTFDPYATRISKAVKMEPGQRTSRVGDWRIIYRVNEKSQEIMVIAFRPRGKAYR